MRAHLVYLMSLFETLSYDNKFRAICGLSDYKVKTIVRPELFGKYVKKNVFLFKILWNCFIYSWLFLFPFYIIGQFIFVAVTVLFSRKLEIDYSKLFLNFTPLLKSRVEYANIEDADALWVTLPFNRRLSDRRNVNILKLATFKEVCKSFYYAFSVYPVILSKFGLSNTFYILQAFEWFLVFEILNNLSDKLVLYFSNQRDRWSILIDKTIQKEKLLLQHGVENSTDVSSVKLNNITTLYSFNNDEAQSLICSCLKCYPKIKYYKSTLNLTSVCTSYDYKILIIGNSSSFFDLESEIIRILKDTAISVLLKPHPVLDKNCYKVFENEVDNFTLLSDDVFPIVDVVVSYKSTLALEYEMSGIEVLYYDETNVIKYLSGL